MISRDMFPRLPFYNGVNYCERNSKQGPELHQSISPAGIEPPYFHNVEIREFGSTLFFATQDRLWMGFTSISVSESAAIRMQSLSVFFARCGAAFARFVGHVFRVGSSEQVGRIAANGIVAGVTSAQPGRNFSIGNHICDTVGISFPPRIIGEKPPVTAGCLTKPRPATVRPKGFVYRIPKALDLFLGQLSDCFSGFAPKFRFSGFHTQSMLIVRAGWVLDTPTRLVYLKPAFAAPQH